MFATDATLELQRITQSPESDVVGSDFDLGYGAMLIAATEYPDVDIEANLSNLDRMAEAVQSRITQDSSSLQQLNVVTDLLFGVIGLDGNRDNYYDPLNSYLHQVLDRRLGIPVMLSLICMEIGRRAGVPIVGVGMPGHFLIRHRDEPDYFVDTFNGGLLLNQDECGALLRESAGEEMRLEPHHLEPVTPRDILARILRNLKAIYWDSNDFDRCITAIGALMAVTPDRPQEQRDRAIVHLKAGNNQASEADFSAYLLAVPDAEDAETVRNALQRLRDSN